MSEIKMEQKEENFKKEFTAVSERIEKSNEMIRKAINNAPSMPFAELEHFPVLQVKIFEYEYFEGKPNVKATDELNRDLESFMYENNLNHDNISDFKVAIEPGKMTPFGRSYPNLYLRAVLIYWKCGENSSDR